MTVKEYLLPSYISFSANGESSVFNRVQAETALNPFPKLPRQVKLFRHVHYRYHYVLTPDSGSQMFPKNISFPLL